MNKMQGKTSADKGWGAVHEDGTDFPGEEHPAMVALREARPVTNTVMGVKNPLKKDITWIIINAVPYFKKGEKKPFQVFTTFEDITERRNAQDDKLKLERQMLHMQKLESLGVLAGGIAHDFNNILMAVLGHTDLAMAKLQPMSPATENIKEIENAVKRAADLSAQMLAYSGKGRFVIESIDLGELVSEMVHFFKASITKKAILNLNLEKNLPRMEGDSTQIRQILMNLITNASEAIGEKSGVITISTGALECTKEYLQELFYYNELNCGYYVYLEVSDTGCGMEKSTIDKIFEPFYTTKFTGRGLGMAAVLGIIKSHKGAIRIYSEIGKGSTFKVLFPVSEREGKNLKKESKINLPRKHIDGKILIVDDEETVRTVGKMMLETLGFSAITASNGEEALKIIECKNAEIELIILDMTMPHMDGEETFREIRKVMPEVRVIMTSGYTEQDIFPRFAGKKLAGFIQKPFTLNQLAEIIDKVI